MEYQPRFKDTDQQKKEENLTVELVKDLHMIQKVFININKSTFSDE